MSTPGTLQLAEVSRLPLWVIVGYLTLLLLLGAVSAVFFRGTSKDYFVASRSIGPFLLLMSVFGTTMTGFALVGSSAKSFELGVGVYGLMASWSGLIHSAIFFVVGIKLWAIGKRYGYVTQVQFFRDRFDSPTLGWILFPILVALVIPYLLVGIIAACKTVGPITIGMFPEAFPDTRGSLPPWITALAVCFVVLCYVLFGGVRSAAWANTFQTIVFMIMGVTAFVLISDALGGPAEASRMVLRESPENADRSQIGYLHFFSYFVIPLSVGMFPHLFQHWMTAKKAKTFRLTVVVHPLFMMLVWVPCVIVGMWAAGLYASGGLAMPNVDNQMVVSVETDTGEPMQVRAKPNGEPVLNDAGEMVPASGARVNANAALARLVAFLLDNPLLIGLLTAGILAAIMSSLDSQFVCLGTMFTNDVVSRVAGRERFSDRQMIWLARGFVLVIVAISYALSLMLLNTNVFDLGVWCFTGFGCLFPLVFAALYWRRATRAGAIACVLATVGTWGLFFWDDILNKGDKVFGSPHNGEYLVLGMMPAIFIFSASVLALVLVSLATKAPDEQALHKFFPAKP
ncbi:MAG: sodium:solute symporter [Phycisphaeraceae bacterium]